MKKTSLRQQPAADRPPKGERKPRKTDVQEQRATGPFTTTEQLCDIWERILSDSDGRRALKRLDEAGFQISHLKPRDANFKHPTWADYIAALPLLPNKPSTRRIHSKIRSRKQRSLIQELRCVAAKMDSPFTEVTIFGRKDDPDSALSTRDDLLNAARTIEDFLSWDYCVRNLNPRHALIAELRWTIRQRTGRPHDRELNDLIASAFRVAGSKEDSYIDSTALDRIEKRAMESRTKSHKRIRFLMSRS